MTQGDIHSRKKRIKNTLSEIEENSEISKANKETIQGFHDYLATQDLSNDRVSRYLYTWQILAEHINFTIEEAEKEDLMSLAGDISQDRVKDKELSDYTKMEYKKAIRKMYTAYLEEINPEMDGESLVGFINLTVDRKQVDPDRLPTPSTVKSLVKHTEKTRDKALITLIWGSGGRIGEILGLKWKDVRFKDDMATVTFRDTKTGGDRTVPLRPGMLYLKELKNQAADPEPDEYVFKSRYDNQLSYNSAYTAIKRAREKTDIPDGIKTNPHAFRKGRATFMAAQGMNQAQLCEFFGWVQGSQHAAVYVRLAESDVENGLRSMYGMKEKEDDQEEDLVPVRCHECGNLNKFEVESCANCDEVLTSSNFFEESKIRETKEELKTRMIEKQIGYDDEELDQIAEDLVDKKF